MWAVFLLVIHSGFVIYGRESFKTSIHVCHGRAFSNSVHFLVFLRAFSADYHFIRILVILFLLYLFIWPFYYVPSVPMFYSEICLFPLHPVVVLPSCILPRLVARIFCSFPLLLVLLDPVSVSFKSPFFP